MKRLGLVSKVVPAIKDGDNWVRNPSVVLDKYVEDGEIVFGEFKKGEEYKEARTYVKRAKEQNNVSLELLDREVNGIVWTFANLFPGCLIKAMDSIRAKKKFFWNHTKDYNRHWLAANMNYEAFLGFQAFNTRKITGKDTIDFIKFRQLIAQGKLADEEMYEAVLPKPKDKPAN